MGFVYMIYNTSDEACYIGATTYTIKKRYTEHIYNFKTKKGCCSSRLLFEKYGIENCKLKELQECNDYELLECEKFWIKRYEKILINKITYNKTMSGIIEQLNKNRPNLTTSSLKSYESTIRTLFKNLEGEGNPVDFFINEQPKVIKFLDTFTPLKRKMRLASLVSLTSHDPKVSEKYQQQMIKDIKTTNAELEEQKRTPTQRQNWISQEEIQKLHNNLREATAYLFKKNQLTDREKMAFQDYLILSLYVLNPPRRIQDYTYMVLGTPEGSDENFISKKQFHFVKYKTAKKYGEQVVNINPKLAYIIQKWKKINPNQKWLLVSEKGEQLTTPALTMRLNKIFGGKKISVNLLRHIYITDEVMKDVPALKDLQQKAEDMGHSVETAMLYKKID